MPTAVEIPCPSGPVVVSTPGAHQYSGWPGRSRADLPKLLDVVDAQPFVAADAGQIEQAVQQHAAVAAGQDEPVAIGPMRDRTRRISARRAREPSRRRPCPLAGRGGRSWPSPPHRGRESGSRSPLRHETRSPPSGLSLRDLGAASSRSQARGPRGPLQAGGPHVRVRRSKEPVNYSPRRLRRALTPRSTIA